jgi:AraC-like DNA-binding protein
VLVERLRETPEWDSRFRMLETAVASRLIAAREPSNEVSWAWSEIERPGDGTTIGGIAEELGWGKKRLIARFREQIGVAPKTAARVVRFSRAVRALEDAQEPYWAAVALECGYYDQSHMVREFRDFAGMTPGEFVALRRDGGELSPD